MPSFVRFSLTSAGTNIPGSVIPALDIPGLDVVSTAKGFGCPSVLAKTKAEIKEAFANALKADGPTLIAIPIAHQERPLVAPVAD